MNAQEQCANQELGGCSGAGFSEKAGASEPPNRV